MQPLVFNGISHSDAAKPWTQAEAWPKDAQRSARTSFCVMHQWFGHCFQTQ
jgi:hypothetical protein